MVTLIVR